MVVKLLGILAFANRRRSSQRELGYNWLHIPDEQAQAKLRKILLIRYGFVEPIPADLSEDQKHILSLNNNAAYEKAREYINLAVDRIIAKTSGLLSFNSISAAFAGLIISNIKSHLSVLILGAVAAALFLLSSILSLTTMFVNWNENVEGYATAEQEFYGALNVSAHRSWVICLSIFLSLFGVLFLSFSVGSLVLLHQTPPLAGQTQYSPSVSEAALDDILKWDYKNQSQVDDTIRSLFLSSGVSEATLEEVLREQRQIDVTLRRSLSAAQTSSQSPNKMSPKP